MAKSNIYMETDEKGNKKLQIGIDVKSATNLAIEYFLDTYSKLITKGEMGGVRLEEIEKSEDEKYWYITVGYDDQPPKNLKSLADLVGRPIRRYKTITIDSKNGKVISMKIRQV